MSHKRKEEDNRRLKKLYEETKNEFGSGVYYCERKKRLIRYSAVRSGTGKELRRISNQRVRRTDPDFAMKGSMYRKVFDYWWTIF